MTQDEIIEMARQAGMAYEEKLEVYVANIDDLQDFAKLVRNHYSYTHAHLWLTRIEGAVKAEREACALICDAEQKKNEDKGQWMWEAKLCGIAIRARGEA